MYVFTQVLQRACVHNNTGTVRYGTVEYRNLPVSCTDKAKLYLYSSVPQQLSIILHRMSCPRDPGSQQASWPVPYSSIILTTIGHSLIILIIFPPVGLVYHRSLSWMDMFPSLME